MSGEGHLPNRPVLGDRPKSGAKASRLIDDLASMTLFHPEYQAEEAADALNRLIKRARAINAKRAAS